MRKICSLGRASKSAWEHLNLVHMLVLAAQLGLLDILKDVGGLADQDQLPARLQCGLLYRKLKDMGII